MPSEIGGNRLTTRRPLQVAGVIILLAGAFVVRESFDLKLYTPMGPGPGFFPLCLALLLIALAGLILLDTTLREAEPAAPDLAPSKAGALRLVVLMIGLVAVTLLFEPLGMRLSFFALLSLLPLFLGYRNLPIILAVAIAGSFGVFELFGRVLDIPLPVGMLGV